MLKPKIHTTQKKYMKISQNLSLSHRNDHWGYLGITGEHVFLHRGGDM